MGITIHYHGTLDDPRVLPEMLIAMRHFCFKRGWKYIDVDDRIIGTVERWIPGDGEEIQTAESPIDDTLRGVIIQPHPKSESVWLTFNQHGELCFYHGEEKAGQYWEQRGGFTKTQFAPMDTHIAICELLHLLQDHYFPSLDVSDEGEYWETRDPAKLAQNLGMLDRLMDSLSQRLDDKGISHERGKSIDIRDPEWKRDHGTSAGKN